MTSESPLLRLPPEILQNIFFHCSHKELVNLGLTCHYVHEAVQDEVLWKNLTDKEYHIKVITGRTLNTYKKLYQKLLHPYGWMVGLYWSKIDYFGGLLEIKVSGDSIVANSLSVNAEGILESQPCFEVCASTHPPVQLCSMIERAHVTQITPCTDKESLRQKCQFTDTKFSQGYYNYNTLDGFRIMTFIDAHRLGIIHNPLVIPPLSSIPKQMWMKPVLSTSSSKSSTNSTSSQSSSSIAYSKSSIQHQSSSVNGSIASTSSSTTSGAVTGRGKRSLSADANLSSRVSPAAGLAAISYEQVINNLLGLVNRRCVRQDEDNDMDWIGSTYDSDTASESEEMEQKRRHKETTDSRDSVNGNTRSVSSNEMSSASLPKSKSGECSLAQSTSSLSKGYKKNVDSSTSCKENGDTSMSTSSISNASTSSNSSIDSVSYFAKYQNNPLGNSRQELAQLYKETYCQPFPSEPILGATADILGKLPDSRRSEFYKKENKQKRLATINISPKDLPPHVLIPGLYVAHYGAHGYEIVLLEYKIKEVCLVKVLGDQFVPAREVSVKISLPYSFSLTAEEQRTLSCKQLIEMDPASSSQPLSECNEQPFVLPPFCTTDVQGTIPSKCWARYHGFGQIASLYHSQPKFTRAHIVVFNNDTLGVLFLRLNVFMMFKRIERDFPQRATLRNRRSSSVNTSLFNSNVKVC